MNHIFGPVHSRRLGRSLGIDLFLRKICNLNCIYCEVGQTVLLTCKRDQYVPTERIIREIEEFCSIPQRLESLDVVTVTASGEPTLHRGLGEILSCLKRFAGKPIVVLTNGTTLTDDDVCAELQQADVVIPSLDSAIPESFRRINRPAACLSLEEILGGLIAFSHSFQGKIWLEILFAKGINDSPEDVAALCDVLPSIRLDRIQLNTVARPPLENYALPVEFDFLQSIAKRMCELLHSVPIDLLQGSIGGEQAESITPNHSLGCPANKPKEMIRLQEILNMLKRRPCTAADINRTFELGGPQEVEQLLEPLVRAGKVVVRPHGNKLYYQ